MIPEIYRQSCWTDTDWLYIQGLTKAIDNVPQKYICECDGERRFHLERVFSYELYYRWAKLLNFRQENPERLMLNAELSKHYYDMDKYKFPDMVLHGNYTNRDKQFIICEIKSSRNSIKENSLKKDVESLFGGVRELNYHCGVFIYLGNRVNKIILKIRSLFQSYENYEGGKYLFIGVNGGTPHYEII
ncbi:MAG: hypothetical protein IKN01_07650 [Prevotella sp.]|nr:hypothetical protein [Prevotella sp.]